MFLFCVCLNSIYIRNMEDKNFLSTLPPQNSVTYESEISIQRRKKKQQQQNKRFNDDQIRSLESMFKTNTKLEPKRKLQIARELELQPRQVAIWFQNRRARWKSKHLEQEYNLLEQNYDNLNSQYQSLHNEQQTLLTQLEKLRDALGETADHRGVISKGFEGNSEDQGLNNEYTNGELEPNTTSITDGLDNGKTNMQSDNEGSGNKGYSAVYEEPQLLNLCQRLDGSSIPTDKWSNFDHTSSASNWLDFLA